MKPILSYKDTVKLCLDLNPDLKQASVTDTCYKTYPDLAAGIPRPKKRKIFLPPHDRLSSRWDHAFTSMDRGTVKSAPGEKYLAHFKPEHLPKAHYSTGNEGENILNEKTLPPTFKDYQVLDHKAKEEKKPSYNTFTLADKQEKAIEESLRTSLKATNY